jgi:hypothetical protein
MYVNITRDDCKGLLESKELSQLTTRAAAPPIRKPIIALYPNALWCIDLIDLSTYKSPQNRHRSYILNTVDAFSRRCFLESLSTKTAPAVLQAPWSVRVSNPIVSFPTTAENFKANSMNG